MKSTPSPVPATTEDDFSVYCTALLLFGWVRAGAELVAQAPEFAVDVAHDLKRAWDDSNRSAS